jgi:hypothetical protein
LHRLVHLSQAALKYISLKLKEIVNLLGNN